MSGNNTRTQEAIILERLTGATDRKKAWQLAREVRTIMGHYVPEASVRRAVSGLRKQGHTITNTGNGYRLTSQF